MPKGVFACSHTCSTSIYTPTTWPSFGVGTYVYTNSGCSSAFNGGNAFWAIDNISGGSAHFSARINSSGYISMIITC